MSGATADFATALEEMLDWHRTHPDDSLLSALVALPDYQMPVESIRANLALGRPEATDDQLWDALRAVAKPDPAGDHRA